MQAEHVRSDVDHLMGLLVELCSDIFGDSFVLQLASHGIEVVI